MFNPITSNALLALSYEEAHDYLDYHEVEYIHSVRLCPEDQSFTGYKGEYMVRVVTDNGHREVYYDCHLKVCAHRYTK